jgi:hypothetical protein
MTLLVVVVMEGLIVPLALRVQLALEQIRKLARLYHSVHNFVKLYYERS